MYLILLKYEFSTIILNLHRVYRLRKPVFFLRSDAYVTLLPTSYIPYIYSACALSISEYQLNKIVGCEVRSLREKEHISCNDNICVHTDSCSEGTSSHGTFRQNFAALIS